MQAMLWEAQCHSQRHAGARAMLAFAGVLALVACAQTPGRSEALGPVGAIAVSRDGRTVAVSTSEEEVALFDVPPLSFRRLLTAEGAKARPVFDAIFHSPAIAMSPDSTLLVGATAGKEIIGWDTGSGAVRFQVKIRERPTDIAFSADGRSFFTAGATIDRHASDNGALLSQWPIPGTAQATALAPVQDGSYVLAGLSDGRIAQYALDTGKLIQVYTAHAATVTGMAVSSDGVMFASAAGRFDPKVWKMGAGIPESIPLSEMGEAGEALGAAARQSRALAMLGWIFGTARGFQLTGAPTMGAPPAGGKEADERSAQTASGYCGPKIAFSPDGRFIATTAVLSMLSGEFHLVVVDVQQKKAQKVDGIYGCGLAFSADSRVVMTSGLGAPMLWNAETMQRIEAGR